MLTPLPSRFKLHSFGGAESCYRIAIEDSDSGRKGRGYLTYELAPGRAEYRNVVLTNCDWLIEKDSELAMYYRTFVDELNSRSSRRQREPIELTERAKFLVNALAAGARKSERLRIVVHRFGPVPAFCLDHEIQLKIHGQKVKCVIGLFPDRKPKFGLLPRAPYTPFFMGSKGELRESLRIAPSLIFRRYFEDVAEDFHDLRRTVRDRDILRRAKQTEVRLAESIKTKLRLLIPNERLVHSNNPEQKVQWTYFVEHDSLLYEASYARALALFLLNELYPIKGIASRSDDYLELLHGLRQRFVSLLGPDRVDVIEATSKEYQFLKECFSAYAATADQSHGVSDAETLRELAADAPSQWQQEFCKFAAFVRLVRFMTNTGTRTRMFISYHYDIAISDVSRDYVRRVVEQRFGSRVETVFLPPMPPDTSFRHVARAAIWASQGTLAICPANTKAINSDTDKDYKWIARETEYTLLLRKDVLFGIEKGLVREKLNADLANADVGYLVSGSKLPPNKERAKALVRHFTEKVHVQFQIVGLEPIYSAPELDVGVEQFVSSLSERAIEVLLDGYLAQFSRETQRTVILTLALLGPSGSSTRSAIVSQLADTWPDPHLVFGGNTVSRVKEPNPRDSAVRIWDKAFRNMWASVRERRISLGSKGIALLAFRKHLYRERLSLVLRAYLPATGRKEIPLMRDRWLNSWLVRFGLRSEE